MTDSVPIAERLENVLTPVLEQMGFELIQVIYSGERGGKVAVFIDRPQGVDISSCEQVSKAITAERSVDSVLPSGYALEVSSPGVERVLRKPEHFKRFLGKKILVKTSSPIDGRRKFQGRLKSAGDLDFQMDCDNVSVTISYAEVGLARLVFEHGEKGEGS